MYCVTASLIMFFCVGMLLLGAVPTAKAGTTTYNVDITGFSTDPNLSIVGTITYDTTLQSITTSSLSIHDPAVIATLPSLPTILNPSDFQWNATPTALIFVTQAPTSSVGDVVWGDLSGFGFGLFAGHDQITVTETPPPSGANSIPISLNDGQGIVIGTTSATPEPSSYVMAITGFCLAGGFMAVRRRLTKSPI